ncbi:PST family polysaccharide transporter [Rhizobium sp. BE258]|nr:PST family polysaccharide transporter [Rhizobium sp. BE258]
MGMLVVFSGFAQAIGDAGINSAVIYSERNDTAFISTAFWIQTSINIALVALFYFGAHYIADFYSEPELYDISRVMSLNFVLLSMGQIQSSILAREMNFRAISIGNYLAALISSIVALAMAYAGMGIWSLAAMTLTSSLVLLVFLSFSSRWLPSFQFERKAAAAIIRYGSYLLSNNSLNYWMRNGDNLAIGKFLGAVDLGVYNRAYTLMLLPLQNIGAVLGQVMFAAMARLKDDIPSLRALYEKAIKQIALIAFPAMAGLCILSNEVIAVLYGDQWSASAPLLRVLSLVGLLQCIVFPVGWIYSSLGHTRSQFRITLALFPIFLVTIGVGMLWGLIGVTVGYAVWAVISAVWNISVAGGLIGVGLWRYLFVLRKKVISTVAMAAVVVATVHFNEAPNSSLPQLMFQTAIGAAVYCLSCLILRDDEFLELFGKLARKARLIS